MFSWSAELSRLVRLRGRSRWTWTLRSLTRLHSLRLRLAGHLGTDSRPGPLNLPLLKLHFRFRPTDFVGWNNIIRSSRPFNPDLAVCSPLRDASHSPLDHGGVFFPALMDDRLVLLDSLDHAVVGLLVYWNIGVVIPLLVNRVIMNHPVINDWRRLVVVDDGGAVYVGHPDVLVIVHSIEIVLIDHDGVVHIGVISHVDVNLGDVDVVHNHRMRASPRAAAVVRFIWSQGHPAHVNPTVNPADPPRIPEEAYAEEGYADMDAHYRWSPVPVRPHIDPVAVMVGNVTEGLRRDPGLIPVPIGPAAHGKRRPPYGYSDRSPEPSLCAVIVDPLPPSVFIKGV